MESACKVKYCRTEKQGGVMALGASYIRGLKSRFFIIRLRSCMYMIESSIFLSKNPPFLYLGVCYVSDVSCVSTLSDF